jgi:hypothetical protein
MRRRSVITFRPDMESLEAKQPLSAGVSSSVAASHAADKGKADAALSPTEGTPERVNHFVGFLVYRIAEPKIHFTNLTGPFQQVLVQKAQPVPGQTYNVLQIALRNGTAQTFNASDNLSVRLSGQKTSTPILTGNETWKPNQFIVFYVLTKKYYPIQDNLSGGFIFDLEGGNSVAIPGPSGIFLRLKYDPKTFAKTLNWIVTNGQGNATGNATGSGTLVANTAIWTFVSAKTNRLDFGGYF